VTCCLSLLLAIRLKSVKIRSDVALTQTQLRVYAIASTNFFSVYKSWPRSMSDLRFNKSNIIFVDPNVPTTDAFGRPIEYSPFEPDRGFGSVRSLARAWSMRKMQVRFRVNWIDESGQQQ
jgi:hypothetical protein